MGNKKNEDGFGTLVLNNKDLMVLSNR